MAIIMAGKAKELQLLGISSCGGNQSVEKTTINAMKMLSITGLEDSIDVVKGQAAPIVRPAKVLVFYFLH